MLGVTIAWKGMVIDMIGPKLVLTDCLAVYRMCLVYVFEYKEDLDVDLFV